MSSRFQVEVTVLYIENRQSLERTMTTWFSNLNDVILCLYGEGNQLINYVGGYLTFPFAGTIVEKDISSFGILILTTVVNSGD